MKYCQKCGKTFTEERFSFCTECGTTLTTQANPMNTGSDLLLTLNGLVLYKGKQPVGILKIYKDKVEFVRSDKNFVTTGLLTGAFGGGAGAKTARETENIDRYPMKEIAMANKSKHPSISSYVEIVLKNGTKLKYLDRGGLFRPHQLFEAVDIINANLCS